MARKMKSVNPTFSARWHVPCVAHILNISVQAAIKSFGIPSAQAVEPKEGDVTRTAYQYDSDEENELGDVFSLSNENDGARQLLCLGDVVAKMRTLVRSIRSSTQWREHYAKACEDDPKVEDSNMVVLDCPTRWSSTYNMLATAVKKGDVIDEVSKAFGRKGKATKMSKDEWELVKEFCRILGLFAISTYHVCKTPAICDVLYLIDDLKEHMEEVVQQIEDGTFFTCVRRLHEGDHSNMAQACKAMHKKLVQYAEILWANEAITTTTFMNPFHKGSMLRPGIRAATIAYKVQLAPSSTRTAWDEFNQYLTEVMPNEGVFTPLSWWATTRAKRFPLLSAITRELLSVCTTNAPAERMFSVGNAIVTYRRSRLSPINTKTLITVKCWLRADNKRWYADVELESDDKDGQDGVLSYARGRWDDQGHLRPLALGCRLRRPEAVLGRRGGTSSDPTAREDSQGHPPPSDGPWDPSQACKRSQEPSNFASLVALTEQKAEVPFELGSKTTAS
ncbi:putative transcriptional regulator tpeD [Wolffia australiana]